MGHQWLLQGPLKDHLLPVLGFMQIALNLLQAAQRSATMLANQLLLLLHMGIHLYTSHQLRLYPCTATLRLLSLPEVCRTTHHPLAHLPHKELELSVSVLPATGQHRSSSNSRVSRQTGSTFFHPPCPALCLRHHLLLCLPATTTVTTTATTMAMVMAILLVQWVGPLHTPITPQHQF